MQLRLICLLLISTAILADDSTKQATDIITEMEKLYRGNASRSTLTMTIQTPNFRTTVFFVFCLLKKTVESRH
jgi:hypothetical protein